MRRAIPSKFYIVFVIIIEFIIKIFTESLYKPTTPKVENLLTSLPLIGACCTSRTNHQVHHLRHYNYKQDPNHSF